MHESDVRAATLVAAIEAERGRDGGLALPDRATLDAATRAATAAPAGSEDWIRTRTRIAMDRLLPPGDAGSPPARAWLGRSRAIAAPVLAAAAVASVLGAGIDRLAGAPYLRVVEPAIWGLIGFNLVVYGLLALSALGLPPAGESAPTGLARRIAKRLAALGSGRPPAALARVAAPTAWTRFAANWHEAALPLDAARVRAALHAAAAALALGVIAGLYARGLTTDYAVGWESTFLDADAMHALVHALLGPAAALSGLPLPDHELIAAWRVVPGGTANGGGAAATLIHLHALSLVLAVVLPRGVLAGLSWSRARRLRRDLPLPESLQRPVQATAPVATAHDLGRLAVIAHGAVDRARAAALFDALPHAGAAAVVVVATGDEDTAALPDAADSVLLLAPMTATPEIESHGRMLARLRGAFPSARIAVLVDVEPFARRFDAWPQRIEERRAAWRSFATRAGVAVALLDLASADAGRWRATIDEALAAAPRTDAQPR